MATARLRGSGIGTPASASDCSPSRMKPMAASTRRAASPGRRCWRPTRRPTHGAEEDPGEGLQHLLVELPVARGEYGAHDLDHGCERRTLLALTEPLVAEDRRPVLDHDAAVGGLLDDVEEGPQAGLRLEPRVALALEASSGSPCGPRSRPLEDRLEERLLAGEVVVERALGDARAGDDLVQRGRGIALLGEELLAPPRSAPAWWSWRTASAFLRPAERPGTFGISLEAAGLLIRASVGTADRVGTVAM